MAEGRWRMGSSRVALASSWPISANWVGLGAEALAMARVGGWGKAKRYEWRCASSAWDGMNYLFWFHHGSTVVQ